ncbi:MAG: class I SAM-dependent methyltransferase [Bacillota bacterium]
MGFYEQIAPYYDYIFPAREEQLECIKRLAGRPPKKILDVACGTGVYSISLAQQGYDVWATDIDAEMVRQVRRKAMENKVAVNAFVSDMRYLDQHISELFDCVMCIGNSIVHLENVDSILAAVIQMKNRLTTSGKLLLQIVNYDRVLAKGITSLPTIHNEEISLEFRRNYTRDKKRGLIYFDTELIVKEGDKSTRFANRVELLPLLSASLQEILEKAGFGSISFYGGFSREPYIPDDSFLLVAEAS